MRHGKTDWNEIHKLQGRTDIPLNEEGKNMADLAKAQRDEIEFDVCYCSPLIRARETAEIVLRDRKIPIIVDERLIEMSFGIYEGVENSFKDPKNPVNVIFKNPEEYKEAFEGAESFEDLFARTGSFLKEVVEPDLAEGKHVLIVGHGAMNCSIICQVNQLPIKDFWSAGIENCKLKRLK